MDSYKEFLENFNSEKVTAWENHYINYKNIVQEIFILFNTVKNEHDTKKKRQQSIIELEENQKSNTTENKTNDNNITPNGNSNNNTNYTEEINNTIETKDSSMSRDKIKSLFALLDKEVKKLHIFYSSKEKDIYKNINKKIQNKSNIINKSCDEIIKEIDNLDYLSQLCLNVLGFIYLNIQALKSILSLLDNSLNTDYQSISYKYIKKFLSKDNSDLIYILSFKTLDETILSIQGILSEYKKVLKTKDEYKKSKELKAKFKDLKNNIRKNILYFDETHEKLFSELTVWKKYLDINLDLPSSSKNSIFKDTPFVGDSFENKKMSKSFLKEKKEKDEKNDNSILDNLESIGIHLLGNDSLNDLKNDISKVISEEDIFSDTTIKLLSRENMRNLNLFYILVSFYFYSYFVIIPKILYLLENKIKGNKDMLKYYGIIISLPSLGNLISQQYINSCIKWNFKFFLIKSLIFVFLHHFLFFYFYEFDYKEIHLIFIARFLLGLSSLDRLCKIYIDNFIPESKQVKSNQKYLKCIYIGYILGLIFSDLDLIIISFLSQKEIEFYLFKFNSKDINSEFEFLYCLNTLFIVIFSIITIITFKNPTNKEFKTLDDLFVNYSKENRLITKFLDNDEKNIAEKQNNMFENANKLTHLSGENGLRGYSDEIKKKKSSHFLKVYLLLILFLITSQYSNENNLMLFPRLLELEKNDSSYSNMTENKNINSDYTDNYNIKDDYYYVTYLGYFFISFSYFISLIVQKHFLKKIFFKKSSKIILIVLFSLSLIIIFVGFWPYLTTEDHDINQGRTFAAIFPIIGNSLMIIISEFLMVVIVNLFIGLLPTGNFRFMCFKASTFINIIDKFSRLLPGILYMIISYNITTRGKKIHLILLSVQLFFIILSLFFCIFYGRYLLKSYSLTRILYTKN